MLRSFVGRWHQPLLTRAIASQSGGVSDVTFYGAAKGATKRQRSQRRGSTDNTTSTCNNNATRDMMTGKTAGLSDTVGFVGCGKMGFHMCSNLIKAGHNVLVYDIDNKKAGRLVELGEEGQVRAAGSLPEVAGHSGVIVTMLPNSSHVRKVYLEQGSGLLGFVEEGALLIDCSTIDPHTSRAVAKRAVQEGGAEMIDAPVSGGTPAAQAGTLTFIVGGQAPAVKRATPLLMAMGKKIFHCGESGAGCVAKLCNNLALAVSMVGVCEAMNLGVSLNVDPNVLAQVMNASTARCWSSDTYNPWPGVMDGVPSSRGYQGGFSAALMEKDLQLALTSAKDSKEDVVLPLGAATHQLYSLMKAQGRGDLDFSGILQLIQGKDFMREDDNLRDGEDTII